MKAKLCIMVMASALLLCLGGCVKYDLHSTTGTDPDPDPGTGTETGTGTVTITPNWENRGEGVEVPSSWTVSLDDVYTGTETGETHTPDYSFEAGSYTLMVWNPATDITVSGTTATVDADANNTSYISGSPDWFFTSVETVSIVADTNNELTPTMQQQVRQLTLTLTTTSDMAANIESIEGNLSGVAGELDFSTNTHSTYSTVVLSFTETTEGSDANYSATVYLLGIVEGDAQTLEFTITYSDSSTQDITSDLTTDLVGFNDDKPTPLSLSTTLEISDGVEFYATIGDWSDDYTFTGEATL